MLDFLLSFWGQMLAACVTGGLIGAWFLVGE